MGLAVLIVRLSPSTPSLSTSCTLHRTLGSGPREETLPRAGLPLCCSRERLRGAGGLRGVHCLPERKCLATNSRLPRNERGGQRQRLTDCSNSKLVLLNSEIDGSSWIISRELRHTLIVASPVRGRSLIAKGCFSDTFSKAAWCWPRARWL